MTNDTILDDLVRISHTLLSDARLEKVLSRVINTMRYHMKCRQCGLILTRESTGGLEVKISRGISETYQRFFRSKKFSMEDQPFKLVAEADHLVRVRPGDETFDLHLEQDFQVLLAGAIRSDEKYVGIAFAQTNDEDGFSHDDEAFFVLLINIVSLALEKTGLLERIKKVEMFDRLTGLLNYNGFQIIAERSFLSHRKRKEVSGVLVLDLDNFKPYRATHGIEQSEKALKETAELIKNCAGESAIIGRYGLDEFIVWLENKEKETACELADSIRKVVGNHLFPMENPRLTASIGVALCPSDRDVDFIEIVGCAKELLYGAKLAENTVKIDLVAE